jgi:hypothetical protein
MPVSTGACVMAAQLISIQRLVLFQGCRSPGLSPEAQPFIVGKHECINLRDLSRLERRIIGVENKLLCLTYEAKMRSALAGFVWACIVAHLQIP